MRTLLKQPFAILFICMLLIISLHHFFPKDLVYPHTEQVVISDEYFDTTITDPYRWLEDDYSKKTKAWVQNQNSFTDRYIRRISFRRKIERRLKEIWDYPSTSTPFQRGDNIYFYKNDGLQNQSILYASSIQKEDERIVIDPNKFSNDGSISLGGIYFSKNNRYMGYSVNSSGSDWREFYILDLETGKLLNDHLKWIKFSGMSWHGNGFYYTRYPEPKEEDKFSITNENSKVYYHHLGTSQTADQIVYYNAKTPRISPSVSSTDDERFLFLYQYNGTYGVSLSFRDTWKSSEGWNPIVEDYNSDIYILDYVNGYFIAETDRNSPFKRIIKIDPKNPNEKYWITLLSGTKDTVISNVKLVGGKLLVHFTKDVLSLWKAYDLNGNYLYNVDLPGKGIVNGFNGKNDQYLTWYSFNNSVNPTTIYQYDVENNISSIYKKSQAKFNYDEYVMRQEFYISKDGTVIPIFLAHKKDLIMDGNRPTLLYGYGGFNISIKPYFSKSNIILLENNGVYAIANIRGGSEYGQDWHEQGMLLNKQNVFDDFIFAAKYLFNEGISSPRYLAIKGGSNGGLLVGAVLNQKPKICKVAFPEVGVMDMLRYENFTIGHAWAVEYGSVKEKKHFENIIKYSPLHNITNGSEYPSVMIYTADHDDRVVPAHSFKYAATLQNSQSGNNPILLRIGMSAGHGAGKPTDQRIKEAAEKWSFMFYEMGIDY